MKYYIGMDIGTSSIKAVLMTEDGKIEKCAREAFIYNQNFDGKSEIDADEFTRLCFKAIKELAAYSKGKAEAICASSASGNLLLLDKNSKPLTPIIGWQDKRVRNEADELLGNFDLDEFYKKVGWMYDKKTFPLSQLLYIKKHNPELLKKRIKFA